MSTAVDTYRGAVDRLAAAQKPAYGAPAYSRFINRPAGRRIAAVAYSLDMSPNQVTAISAVLSGVGIAVLALAPIAPVTGIVVAVFLALGYAFDAADGQLARLTGKGGPAGEWLDHVVDMGKTVLLPSAVVVSLAVHTAVLSPGLAVIALGFATVNVVAFFAWLLVDLLRRSAQIPADPSRPVGHAPLLRSMLRLPGDYGVQCWVFVLWGFAILFWWAYALLALANFVLLVAALPVWFRQAKAVADATGN